ncbi:MAG: glycosyltransferase [Fibromonadales bacterium]|nr:glycosyltransferase [Fibromonadales bacterium]
MPSYNHAPFVEAAIRSAMEQQGANFELLVIDDGSNDESPQIIKKLSEEFGFYFLARKNKGLMPTLLELASAARGKYICTLASDDVMPQNRLKIQAAYMEEHPDVPVCFGQVKRILPNGKLEEQPYAPYLSGVPEISFEELFLNNKSLHGCTELIRRAAFDSVGGYSQKFKLEDYPLWLALSNKYGNLPVLPDVFCHYRILANSKNMHRNFTLMHNQVFEIIAEYKTNALYKKAIANWKANWFSCLTYYNKKEAWQRLPQLFSFSKVFLRRLPKLFIPRMFLKG